MSPEDTTGQDHLDKLIERSSLGNPGARALRRRTPREQAASLVSAAEEPAHASRDVPASWIDAAARGDRNAVENILRFIQPLVQRYCRARLEGTIGLRTTADDVAQEACMEVLTSLPSCRRLGRPFLAFVYGIALRRVRDAIQAASTNRIEFVATVPEHEDSSTGATQEGWADSIEPLEAGVREMLALLPEREREVVVLSILVGLSAEETAVALGSRPGAVRATQHRALSRLRSTPPLRGVDASTPRSYLDSQGPPRRRES